MRCFNYICIAFLCMLIFLPAGMQAQDGEEEDSMYQEEEQDVVSRAGMIYSLDFQLTAPIGLMRKRIQKPVVGLSTQFLFQPDKSRPFFTGLAITFGQYDSEWQEYYDYVEFEENLFRETIHCDLFGIEWKGRYFPGWTLRIAEPYVDLGLGIRNSFAYTEVENVDYGENALMRIEDSDWTFGYSLGIGALLRLDKETDTGFGHFSLSYSGGENSFLYLERKDALKTDIPVDRFDRRSIPVQMVRIDIGILFYF